MKLDRRDTPRIPIALEALLLSGQNGLKRVRTRDISLDGVFVLTPGMRPADGPIDMAIRLPGDGAPRYHRFVAKPVRVESAGAGFAFESTDSDAYAALLGLMFTHAPAEPG
jgi:hypothetical protein